jgi:hypothetical protein
MVKGMPEKIKGILTMSTKKKPFLVQHTVLSIKIKNLSLVNREQGAKVI